VGAGGVIHARAFSHAALPYDAEQADDTKGAAGADCDYGDAEEGGSRRARE